MTDSQTPQPVADTSQQVTSKTPTTKQKDQKKSLPEKPSKGKNREAREAQKKYLEAQQKELDEAKIKISELENDQTRSTDHPVEGAKNVLTTTQWHYRFIGGGLLQTRRDQKRFYQKEFC